MPARKEPSPGIGRPLARLEYKIDALAEATARLADATSALLAHAAHPPVMIAPAGSYVTPSDIVARSADPPPVPRGTNGHAEPPPFALSDDRVLDYATIDTDPGFIPLPNDLSASLAAELAAMAEEDEEILPPPTDDDMFDQWARRVDMFRQQKMWLETWGPRPGQEGCLVPPELMRGRHR